jgi:signal transduction histidine kinase
MQKGEIWNFASETSDKYFYQFTRIPSKESDTLLITRVPQKNVSNEKRIRTILKVLMIVIFLTAVSLALITIISRNIFNSLNKIEKSSSQLAEGKLDKPITNDISAARQNEFSTIMHSLEKMRCELIEMQASKNRFMMGISHDLRTPVAVIKGYSEAIMDGVISDKDEIQKSMELIEQKTSQLEEMIDTLLNYMKLNNFEIKEQLVKKSISRLIINFSKYAEVTAKIFKRNVHTNIELPEDIEEISISSDNLENGCIWIAKLLVLLKLSPSTSEARRSVEQGAVKINNDKITDTKLNIELKSGDIVQVGKRKIAKVKL